MALSLYHFKPLKCNYDDCSGSLVIRKQKDNDVYFLGCSKFPRCDETISIDSEKLINIDMYFTSTNNHMHIYSQKELLSHIRHLIIFRELSEKHIGQHNSNLSSIDYNRLNNMLKFDSIRELSEWIQTEIDNGNIDIRLHSPLGSPYSDCIYYRFLPYIKDNWIGLK